MMMKYFTIAFLFLVVIWNDGRAQQLRNDTSDSLKIIIPKLHSPDVGSPDIISPDVISPEDGRMLAPGALAEIPTIDFPKGAKMLTWWPDDGVHYFMPNMLSSESKINRIDGLKLKGRK